MTRLDRDPSDPYDDPRPAEEVGARSDPVKATEDWRLR